jgi:hypothetical protein
VEALLALQERSSTVFTDLERKKLSETATGHRLAHIFQQCKPYREKFWASKASYEKSKSAESKKQYAVDLIILQSCLSARACPHRWQVYGQCWSQIPPQLVREYSDAGVIKYLCASERQGVERCVSNLVSQAVREATEEESGTDNLMVIS